MCHVIEVTIYYMDCDNLISDVKFRDINISTAYIKEDNICST